MQVVRILLGANDAYAMPLAVAAHSALYHLDTSLNVEVHIVCDGISEGNRRRIQACLTSAHPHARLQWHHPDFEEFRGVNVRHYSMASLSRLMVPSLFSDDVERVLYLDSDLVVEADVAELWSRPLGRQAVWAVQDRSDAGFEENIRSKFPDIEAPAGAQYFNSGVLLVNLPQWRAQNITGRTLAFLKEHGDRLSFPDQDALNAVLCGDWGKLPRRWNKQAIEMGGPGDASYREPGVLHFSAYKPWNADYVWRGKMSFHRAYLRSGWESGVGAWRTVGSLLVRQVVHLQFSRIRRLFGLQ